MLKYKEKGKIKKAKKQKKAIFRFLLFKYETIFQWQSFSPVRFM